MIIGGKFFSFLIETICCDPSSKTSRQEGSDEGSQYVSVQNLQISQVIFKYSFLSRILKTFCLDFNKFK